MAAQQNKALVRRLFEEVWNSGNTDAAKELIHADYRSPENIGFDSARGLGVLAGDVKFYRELYGDLNFKIERMFTQGDTVVTTWRASGIANNEFFTSRSGAQHNKKLEAEGVSLTTFADGKIKEHRLYWSRKLLFP